MHATLLSWNIWCGHDMPGVMKLLKKERPDIIALQEVVEDDDGRNNSAEIIAKVLGYQWQFGFVSMYTKFGKSMRWGEAVLSRYDIVKSEVLGLSTNPRHIALRADIKVGSGLLHVCSTHLTAAANSELRNHQYHEAQTLCEQMSVPHTIIAGDFNATPESKTIAVMRKHFVDADTKNQPTWCVCPKGGGEPQFDAIKYRYDYIFHTRDLKVSRLSTIRTTASDHLPVTAAIRLQGLSS